MCESFSQVCSSTKSSIRWLNELKCMLMTVAHQARDAQRKYKRLIAGFKGYRKTLLNVAAPANAFYVFKACCSRCSISYSRQHIVFLELVGFLAKFTRHLRSTDTFSTEGQWWSHTC